MEFLFALLLNPINDITTSFTEPPAFQSGAAYNSEFTEIQKKVHPEVQPKETPHPPSEVFEKVHQLAQSEGWEVTVLDAQKLHLEAVATTSLMKFKDDVAIDVRPTAKGSAVHMRSRSRVGKSDLGANAKRIVRFLDKI